VDKHDIESLRSYLKSLPKLNDKSKSSRTKRAREDFFYFIKTYFGHHIENCKKETSYFRDFIHNNIEDIVSKNKISLFTAYRGGAKTTTITKLYTMWKIVKKDKRYIVLISSTDKLAKSLLEFISEELEFNENLKSDFGISTKKDIASEIVVNVDKYLIKVESFGYGAKIRGIVFLSYRPDLIILDDIENDENVSVKAQRDKLENWYKKAIKKLPSRTKKYNIIIVGTILHHDSLLARLSKSDNIFFKNFPLVRDFDSWELDNPRLDLKEIQAEYYEDKDSFYQEYQNMPLSQDSLMFYGYKSFEENIKCDFYSIGIDPSMGKKNGDWFAISILGYHRQSKKFYATSKGYKKSPSDMIDTIINIYKKYDRLAQTIVSIETVAYQEFFKQVLLKVSKEIGLFMSIKEFRNTAPKELRIQTLAPLIKNGDILIDKTSTLLIDELDTYPKSAHDDLLDSLEMAYRNYKLGGGVDYKLVRDKQRELKKFKSISKVF
jgi:predicted phage terminase large subunit-like protein